MAKFKCVKKIIVNALYLEDKDVVPIVQTKTKISSRLCNILLPLGFIDVFLRRNSNYVIYFKFSTMFELSPWTTSITIPIDPESCLLVHSVDPDLLNNNDFTLLLCIVNCNVDTI